MTQPSPIPWRTVGVVGSVEIISGSEYGSFVPVAKVHGFGPGPGGAPNLAEAWSNARFIADAAGEPRHA